MYIDLYMHISEESLSTDDDRPRSSSSDDHSSPISSAPQFPSENCPAPQFPDRDECILGLYFEGVPFARYKDLKIVGKLTWRSGEIDQLYI